MGGESGLHRFPWVGKALKVRIEIRGKEKSDYHLSGVADRFAPGEGTLRLDKLHSRPNRFPKENGQLNVLSDSSFSISKALSEGLKFLAGGWGRKGFVLDCLGACCGVVGGGG